MNANCLQNIFVDQLATQPKCVKCDQNVTPAERANNILHKPLFSVSFLIYCSAQPKDKR